MLLHVRASARSSDVVTTFFVVAYKNRAPDPPKYVAGGADGIGAVASTVRCDWCARAIDGDGDGEGNDADACVETHRLHGDRPVMSVVRMDAPLQCESMS